MLTSIMKRLAGSVRHSLYLPVLDLAPLRCQSSEVADSFSWKAVTLHRSD
ncbi:hypothetical protein ADIMK_2060 [Marinobacterium lacunae]|uniref:Uncharacterized protein n=1 Tax=Marinobacterium lacunae TaxID=1232683 RepID=A0A081FZ03_9GAMM|nr:hypothetical protein ADIMK_2060 [Marinobacterium lacunae]